MGESGQTNELFEIPRHELRPIVGNDPGMNSRVLPQAGNTTPPFFQFHLKQNTPHPAAFWEEP